MTTSVAMCTYNGARYIEEQLRSIINQTVPVGEIVVCDDGSKDETVDIIKNIALTTSIPIRIYINDVNLGCTKNFYKAMSLCEGDIIFLSDQDDVWLSHKVETILNWFKVNNDKKVLFSDAELINSEGELIIGSTYFYLNFDEKSQQFFNNGFAVELFAHRNRACGATMALRKGVLSYLLPLSRMAR